MSRKLAPETLRKFRTEWYLRVERGREDSDSGQQAPSGPVVAGERDFADEVLVALARHDVRKLSARLQAAASWSDVPRLLDELALYATRSDMRVSGEILDALDWITTKTRGGMPSGVAAAVSGIAGLAAPTWNLVGPGRRSIPAAELKVLEDAILVGSGLAYDGAKYLRELSVVDSGAHLLWKVLRFAHLNNLDGLKRSAIEGFDLALQGAQDSIGGAFEDSTRWLNFKRDDALAVGDDPIPPMPTDLHERLIAAERG